MNWKQLLLLIVVVFGLNACGGEYESGFRYVAVETEFGVMEFKLYNSTPQHRDNFIKLIKEDFYEGLLFHRIMPEFMAQGGDPKSKGAGPEVQLGGSGPGYTLEKEFGALHYKGALAAARQPDQVNPKKESSGSQFYIVQGKTWTDAELAQIQKRGGFEYSPEQIDLYKTLGGTPFLDNDYTVFGECVKGLEIIDLLCAVPINQGSKRPIQDVPMSVRVIK
ncbi:MAG: peptidylprolyl isomerase [Bacteroidota bacterium]